MDALAMGKSTVDEDLRARRSPWKKIAVEEDLRGGNSYGRDTPWPIPMVRYPHRDEHRATAIAQRGHRATIDTAMLTARHFQFRPTIDSGRN